MLSVGINTSGDTGEKLYDLLGEIDLEDADCQALQLANFQSDETREITGNDRRQSQENRLEFGLDISRESRGANNLDC
jgi:hypothetical protein